MKDIDLSGTPLEFPNEDPITNEVCPSGCCNATTMDKECVDKTKQAYG